MKTINAWEINSAGIREVFAGQKLEIVASVGNGDSKLTLYRSLGSGMEVIETNGDPLYEEVTDGFTAVRTQIVGQRLGWDKI